MTKDFFIKKWISKPDLDGWKKLEMLNDFNRLFEVFESGGEWEASKFVQRWGFIQDQQGRTFDNKIKMEDDLNAIFETYFM